MLYIKFSYVIMCYTTNITRNQQGIHNEVLRITLTM